MKLTFPDGTTHNVKALSIDGYMNPLPLDVNDINDHTQLILSITYETED
jgi:hypothetical protein